MAIYKHSSYALRFSGMEAKAGHVDMGSQGRLLAGKITRSSLAVGVGVVAPVVTLDSMASAASAPESTSLHMAAVSTSQYESCTPYFGLGKASAELAHFSVNDPAHLLGSSPAIGSDIVPLITATDGTHTVTCVPTLAWTSQSDWLSGSQFGLQGSSPAQGGFIYPGDGYYAVPFAGVPYTLTPTTSSLAGSFTPTSVTVSYLTSAVGALNRTSPTTVTASTTATYPNDGLVPTTTAAGAATEQAIMAQISSTDPNRSAIDALVVAMLAQGSGACTLPDGDPVLASLEGALQALGFSLGIDCGEIPNSLSRFSTVKVMAARALDNHFVFDVSMVQPTTTTTTSPSTTTTSTETLASTGSSSLELSLGAVLLVVLGATGLGLRRRRRII